MKTFTVENELSGSNFKLPVYSDVSKNVPEFDKNHPMLPPPVARHPKVGYEKLGRYFSTIFKNRFFTIYLQAIEVFYIIYK